MSNPSWYCLPTEARVRLRVADSPKGGTMGSSAGKPSEEPTWRLLFQAALVEIDPLVLPRRIEAAEGTRERPGHH